MNSVTIRKISNGFILTSVDVFVPTPMGAGSNEKFFATLGEVYAYLTSAGIAFDVLPQPVTP